MEFTVNELISSVDILNKNLDIVNECKNIKLKFSYLKNLKTLQQVANSYIETVRELYKDEDIQEYLSELSQLQKENKTKEIKQLNEKKKNIVEKLKEIDTQASKIFNSKVIEDIKLHKIKVEDLCDSVPINLLNILDNLHILEE